MWRVAASTAALGLSPDSPRCHCPPGFAAGLDHLADIESSGMGNAPLGVIIHTPEKVGSLADNISPGCIFRNLFKEMAYRLFLD